jgi:hypothetical protein
MKEFDIEMNMNGVKNELNSNFVDLSQQVNIYNKFEGEPTDVEQKKSWTEKLDNITQVVRDTTNYLTNQQVEVDEELANKGKKHRILGMNPIVAIAISFVIIIGGSVAIAKIKA